MKWLIDAQLPPALARYISSKGEDAMHVVDLHMMESPDHQIWQLALNEKRIIVTKDEDFQIQASVSTESPQIVWVRIGNCSKQELLAFFEEHWERLYTELQQGTGLIELLG